jgi:hypothetical protein
MFRECGFRSALYSTQIFPWHGFEPLILARFCTGGNNLTLQGESTEIQRRNAYRSTRAGEIDYLIMRLLEKVASQ